jgi:hypothetical protein
MLVCPQCKAKYKKTLFKRRRFCECTAKAKLVNIFTLEDTKVHSINTPYGNPDLWAKSTLPKEFDGELAEVYKIKAGKLVSCPRERAWLHDLLDDNNIAYRIEISGEYPMQAGGFRRSRKFKEFQLIYVEKENEKRALRLIKKFLYSQNIVTADETFDDSREEFDSADRPQVACPVCGKECDSDYIKCPACKASMY